MTLAVSGVAVERHEPVHIVPHLLAVRMEDVCTVLVDIDALHTLTVDVSTEVRSLIYHQTRLSPERGFVCKRSPEQA